MTAIFDVTRRVTMHDADDQLQAFINSLDPDKNPSSNKQISEQKYNHSKVFWQGLS